MVTSSEPTGFSCKIDSSNLSNSFDMASPLFNFLLLNFEYPDEPFEYPNRFRRRANDNRCDVVPAACVICETDEPVSSLLRTAPVAENCGDLDVGEFTSE